jgi:TolB protein
MDRAERERRNAFLVTGVIVLVVLGFAVSSFWPDGEPPPQGTAPSPTVEQELPPQPDIYVYDLKSEQGIRLTDYSGPDVYPAWSPDGSKIAFARFSEKDLHDIFVVDADGGDPVRLVGGPTDDFAPSWSPDGEEIVFMSDRSTFADLFVVDSGTGAVRVKRIGESPTGDEWPEWSPVADRIAYVEERPDSDETRILTVRSDGSDKRIVAVLDGCCEATRLDWSRNGLFLAFTWEGDVWVADARGGSLIRRLTFDPVEEGYASWSPDGDQLIFQKHRTDEDVVDIYSIRFRGLKERELIATPWNNANPDWSPDGRYIAFESITGY